MNTSFPSGLAIFASAAGGRKGPQSGQPKIQSA